jgi:hypothetical protein
VNEGPTPKHEEPRIALEVSDSEYCRLLGLPRREPLSDTLAERARTAREWYAKNGRPFSVARQFEITSVDGDVVALTDGTTLKSTALSGRLRRASSPSLAVIAVTAGPEVDAETDRLWKDDRPDEAFFLDRLGAAMVEELIRRTSIAICRSAEARQLTALPPLSPGCSDWDFADQHTLFGLFGDSTGPLTIMSSGMVSPKNSMLAAVGLTRQQYAMTAREACQWCDLSPCAYRRAPYAQGTGRRNSSDVEVSG